MYPKLPENEKLRQEAVDKYKNLSGLSKQSYDNITSIIASICETPISLISILDYNKNIFKSNYGSKLTETSRDLSFCGHAIHSNDEILIVKDSRIDERFCDNPFVLDGNAVFYAGVPIVTPEGYKLGTLCVFDNKPRELNESQKNALIILANQVMILFEKEYQNDVLEKLQESLKIRNTNLEKFAGIVSHDLKSPLANIIALTQLLEDEENKNLTEDSFLYLKYLKSASFSLKNYIDGILNFYKSDSFIIRNNEIVDLELLVEELKNMIPIENDVIITTNFQFITVTTNKAALQQVLLNLISNSLRYNSKINRRVDLKFFQDESYIYFEVMDNGNGFSIENSLKIFELFNIVAKEDRYHEKGSGIGLATVKKVVESLGGLVTVISKIDEGSTFKFSLKK